MLDLLAQLLPMAGAGAQGFLQGTQKRDQHDQLRQLMALKEAEEMRTQVQFPKQMRAMDQDYAYNAQTQPEKLKQLQLSNTSAALLAQMQGHQAGPTGQRVSDVIKGLSPSFPVDENMPYHQTMDFYGMFNQGERANAVANIRRQPTGAQQDQTKVRLLKQWGDIQRFQTPKQIFDYAIGADPEIAAAIQSAPVTAGTQELLLIIKKELKKLGVDVDVGSGSSAPKNRFDQLASDDSLFSR